MRKYIHEGQCKTNYDAFIDAIYHGAKLHRELYAVTGIPISKLGIRPEIEIGNKIGMKFKTNIDKDKEKDYRKAIHESGIRATIINEAYDYKGRLIERYKAFYVSSGIVDLTDFWFILDRIEKESKLDKK